MATQQVTAASLFADPETSILFGASSHAQNSWLAVPSATEINEANNRRSRWAMWSEDDQSQDD
eukprot:12035454-Karenia_brevis.AAC.1